jgi:hypothetical protein
VFLAAGPLGIVALVLALALRERPLRTSAREPGADDAAAPADERAAAA